MKKRYNIRFLMIPVATFGFAVACAAAPASAFYPSPESAGAQFGAKASADDIQMLTNAPSDGVVVLGELSVDGGSQASLHDLMVAALGEAMSKGADFVALYPANAQPELFLGKMVPVGHGRSMFEAGPVLGSEVGRIATIPPDRSSTIRLILGRYSKRGA
jgi:hypothetical protein